MDRRFEKTLPQKWPIMAYGAQHHSYREIKTKIPIRYHFTLMRIGKTKKKIAEDDMVY